jgi:hypothetical protein
MSTWTTISNGAVAVGGIPASSTVTALRDNPIAIAEAANGSPVVYAGWHPPDKASVGDSEAGLIYDGAVNGSVASIETPDFEDGFEYRIVGKDLRRTSSSSSLQILGYFATAATYRKMLEGSNSFSEGARLYYGFDIEFLMPRVASVAHLVMGRMHGGEKFTNGGDLVTEDDLSQFDTSYEEPAQKILRAQIKLSSGNIDSGKIWLLRRREYISSP